MPLTGAMALKLGPLIFITALTHFLERHKNHESRSKARDELLFDEGATSTDAFVSHMFSENRPNICIRSARPYNLDGRTSITSSPFAITFDGSLHNNEGALEMICQLRRKHSAEDKWWG